MFLTPVNASQPLNAKPEGKYISGPGNILFVSFYPVALHCVLRPISKLSTAPMLVSIYITRDIPCSLPGMYGRSFHAVA